MKRQPVGRSLEDEIQSLGDEFWKALKIGQGRFHDVWGGNSHLPRSEYALISPVLKFLISNGYDLRRVELDLLVWILLHVSIEDMGTTIAKIHHRLMGDVVAMILVVHRVSTKDTWLDLAASAFLKEVTGQEPARIWEEGVERGQTTTAQSRNPNPPSATVAPSGESGPDRDPHMTIHCV